MTSSVAFYNKRLKSNNVLILEEFGRVSLHNEEIQIVPEAFQRWLLDQLDREGKMLSDSKGEAYLDALLKRYAKGTYMFAKREQSSGGANPGGAERA